MLFTDSLKKNRDFKRVYGHKKSAGNHLLVLYVAPNGGARNSLGISVSRKVGGAVVRNRVKRCIREQYRLHESYLQTGYDMVVVARPMAGTLPRESISADLGAALLHLLGKHALKVKP